MTTVPPSLHRNLSDSTVPRDPNATGVAADRPIYESILRDRWCPRWALAINLRPGPNTSRALDELSKLAERGCRLAIGRILLEAERTNSSANLTAERH